MKPFGSGAVATGATLLLLVVGSAAWGYNVLVRSQERVHAARAQVQNVMQRRVDLIPPLAEAARAYAEHERLVLRSLIEARSAYVVAQMPVEETEPAQRLENALERFYALEARYPALRSSRVYANLRHELSGTENRIAIERARYDEALKRHRTLVRRFPLNLIAALLPDPPGRRAE